MSFITAVQAPNPFVPYFLDLIAWSEGTSISPITQNNGYDIIVSGIHGPNRLTDYTDHPFAKGGSIEFKANPPEYSTAAGRYQILAHYFQAYRLKLKLPDFSPMSQDLVAIQMIRERGALGFIAAGQIASAIFAVSNIWASLPGNNYGQGGHSIQTLLTKWDSLQESNK